MAEQTAPLSGQMFPLAYHGETFYLSIERLADGRWDAWVRFADASPESIGHEVGVFDDWDVARETALTTAQLLIERMPMAQRHNLYS